MISDRNHLSSVASRMLHNQQHNNTPFNIVPPSSFWNNKKHLQTAFCVACALVIGLAIAIPLAILQPWSSKNASSSSSASILPLHAELLKCGYNKIIADTANAPIFHEEACPSNSFTSKSRGKWFKFPGNGKCITLSTCHDETTFDTRLRAYLAEDDNDEEQTSETSRICIDGNDDASSSSSLYSTPRGETLSFYDESPETICPTDPLHSILTIQTVPGKWHYILVDSLRDDGTNINVDSQLFTLSITCYNEKCHSNSIDDDDDNLAINNNMTNGAEPTPNPTSNPTPDPTPNPTKKPTRNPTPSPITGKPTSTPTFLTAADKTSPQGLESILSSVSNVSDMKRQGTPQNKAFQWTVQDVQQSNMQWSEEDIKERYILATFYYSTNGTGWDYQYSFLDHSKGICTWNGSYDMGITCPDGSINLKLRYESLEGGIPTELGRLSRLNILDLYSNRLNGIIPTELGQLLSLTRLDLYENALNGTVPSELGQLSNLIHLDLTGNNLEGQLPTELGLLRNLDSLDLDFNYALNGTIPSELGQLSNLTYLDLSSNNLGGQLPKEVGLLRKLDYLDLQDNALNGTVPSELGQLLNITILDLSLNNLEGQLPTEFGLLRNLNFLGLTFNALNGTVPSELGQLSNLTHLDLSSNDLTAQVPIEVGLLSSLQFLYLEFNNLSGTIPLSFSQLENLETLEIHDNSLRGNAEFLCLLPELYHCWIDKDKVQSSCCTSPS